MKLNYVIKYVAEMDRAITFYEEKLGLELRFRSTHWTEFSTGETTLALHLASDEHPAGTAQIGFAAENIEKLYDERNSNGIEFTAPPADTFGTKIAKFLDSEGAECNLSEAA